ncbi:MAG: phosphoadenosine phosphosulfate reductase family protein [Bacteroidetes bacterium]|nr:phosphoadenosine phosphosulfate reductase family protein [Bacteroidota bacterium]MBL7105542.1 phosphoadenosine phosphosulfate reductase family protein [Bacteroidales bacterium]
MSKKVRHLLGISGGKDSTALTIYMRNNYPELDIEYYFCDTGKELEETYSLINELEIFLGKKIKLLRAAEKSNEEPFDHFLKIYGGYLPSSQARWCTKNLKLEPFEKYIGNDLVISYVAIRGDEDREGYISTKPNIQTVFPFRKNIWSIEILNAILGNGNISKVAELYTSFASETITKRAIEIIFTPTSDNFFFSQKVNALLDLSVKTFNKVVFEFLKDTDYPIANLNDFPLIENEEIIVMEDVKKLFKENGVTFPRYYNEVEYEVKGQKGKYARSRSGCFFCFYQQKIEWVWLYERHPQLFEKAMEYEKDGYSWNENERLDELIKPGRIKQIKGEHLKKIRNKILSVKSNKLIDVLDDKEGVSCINCFV